MLLQAAPRERIAELRAAVHGIGPLEIPEVLLFGIAEMDDLWPETALPRHRSTRSRRQLPVRPGSSRNALYD